MPLEYLYNSHVASSGEMLELSLWDAFPMSRKERMPYVWGSAKDAATVRPHRHAFIISFREYLNMANQTFSADAWRKDSLAYLWRLDANESFHDLLHLQTQLDFIQAQPLQEPIIALGPHFFGQELWVNAVLALD